MSLRIGIVPFLNVQPLVWSLQQPGMPDQMQIRASTPRQLAEELERGEHDVAIVPVFEYFRTPDFYTIVPGVSIASRNAVYSVLLFAADPLENIRRVYLDPASLTSVNLVKVIMAERGIKPDYVDVSWQWTPGSTLLPGEAALLIGDPAILERGKHPFQFDLGVLWKELTGLPFVFAAWLVHPSAKNRPLNDLLLQARKEGEANLSTIASDAGPLFGIAPDEALRYFTENLCYELGPPELDGWMRFGELCVKHRLIQRARELLMHTE